MSWFYKYMKLVLVELMVNYLGQIKMNVKFMQNKLVFYILILKKRDYF